MDLIFRKSMIHKFNGRPQTCLEPDGCQSQMPAKKESWSQGTSAFSTFGTQQRAYYYSRDLGAQAVMLLAAEVQASRCSRNCKRSGHAQYRSLCS